MNGVLVSAENTQTYWKIQFFIERTIYIFVSIICDVFHLVMYRIDKLLSVCVKCSITRIKHEMILFQFFYSPFPTCSTPSFENTDIIEILFKGNIAQFSTR
jgi:hypothetical protein